MAALGLLALFLLASLLSPLQKNSGTQEASTLATPPITAEAGGNATVTFGTKFALFGNTTKPLDQQRFMIFTWTFYDHGNQTVAGITPSHAWNHVGTFVVTLNVTWIENRRTGPYYYDNVTIKVIPRADAGPLTKKVVLGTDNSTVVFNGSGSQSDLGIVSWDWTVMRGDSQVGTMSGKEVTFTFQKSGTYNVNLTVTDNGSNSAYTVVTVHVRNQPSIIEKNIVFFFFWLPIIIIIGYFVMRKLQKDRALITKTDIEKGKLQYKNMRKTWKIFHSNRLGFGGLVVLGIFVVMAVFAPLLATVPHPTQTLEPTRIAENWINPLPPSLKPSPFTGLVHPFGTDHKGQDIYSMTLFGSRASLEVGMIATLISVAVGTTVGLASGYWGRVTDEVLMRLTDFFLVLPWFPLMIVMMAILGQKFIWVIVVIGITSWPSTARVVRSQVLTVKERQFIVRARAVGAGDGHIIKTHILPNVLPLIFANTVLLIATAIFSEAFLDFFGLGDSRVISWGSMLESAYEQNAFLLGAWWWIVIPGFAIVAMVLAFSMVGYALDDVLNPKLRRR